MKLITAECVEKVLQHTSYRPPSQSGCRPARIRNRKTKNWVVTFSNRTVWLSSSDAILALNQHIEHILGSLFHPTHPKYIGPDKKTYTYKQIEEIKKNVTKKLLKEVYQIVEL